VGAMMPDFPHCELVTVPPYIVDGKAFAIQRPLATAQKVDQVMREQSDSGSRKPAVVDLIHLDFFLHFRRPEMLPIFCAYTSEARFVGMDDGNSSGRSVPSTPCDPTARNLLIVFARIARCAMLIAASALLVGVKQQGATNPR